ALAADSPISEAEVLELPVEVHVGVAPAVEVSEERVRPAAEPAARVAKGQARDEWPHPGLLESDERRLDESLGLGQLRPVSQRERDEFLERAVIRHQAEDRLGRLDR